MAKNWHGLKRIILEILSMISPVCGGGGVTFASVRKRIKCVRLLFNQKLIVGKVDHLLNKR